MKKKIKPYIEVEGIRYYTLSLLPECTRLALIVFTINYKNRRYRALVKRMKGRVCK